MYYGTGDAFNKATWSHLKKSLVATEGPMNVVLSDGLHIATAVLAEFEGLLHNDIIQPEPGKPFTMVWDDCETGIKDAVLHNIQPRLQRLFSGRSVCHGWFEINGWIG